MRTRNALGSMLAAVPVVLAPPEGSSIGPGERWVSANEPGAYHMIHAYDLQDPALVDELREHRLVVCSASMDLQEIHEMLPETIPFAALTFMLVPDWGHGNPFWDGWRATLTESDYYHDAEGNRIKSVWNAYWVRTTPDYGNRIAHFFADNLEEWDGLYIDMYLLQWQPWHIAYLQEHGAVEPIDQNVHQAALNAFGTTLRSRIGDQLMIVNTSGFPGDYVNGITLENPTQRFGREYALEQYRNALNACADRGRPCFNVSWYEDLEISGLVMPGNVDAPP